MAAVPLSLSCAIVRYTDANVGRQTKRTIALQLRSYVQRATSHPLTHSYPSHLSQSQQQATGAACSGEPGEATSASPVPASSERLARPQQIPGSNIVII